jgi:hypothetical protein
MNQRRAVVVGVYRAAPQQERDHPGIDAGSAQELEPTVPLLFLGDHVLVRNRWAAM